MNHGTKLVHQADAHIYSIELSRENRAHVLTSMAILSGLVSDGMPIASPPLP